MKEIDHIKKLELEFPTIFADKEERTFGVMFYNAENYDSHDSNHALILLNEDEEKAISEIKNFYLSKNLNPRIYSSLENEQLPRLRAKLENNGFTVENYGNQEYLVFSGKSNITEPYTLDFRRFTKNDDFSVFNKILENEDSIIRTQNVIKRRVNDDNYYLYIGYLDQIPVVMASFQFDENKTARMDEVETAESYRNRGFARQITRHLTDVFLAEGGQLFFTWATDSSAKKIYLQGGFETKYSFPHWSAYIVIR